MTKMFDPRDRMWEIRVQPYDIITYLADPEDPAHHGKRKIGKVGDVNSSVSTAGRITIYEVRGPVWEDGAEEVINTQDPQRATPELAAEFRVQEEESRKRRRASSASAAATENP